MTGRKDMDDQLLETLLGDYLEPVSDAGFSAAVMARLSEPVAETVRGRIPELAPARRRWVSPFIALMLGLVAGTAANLFMGTLSLPLGELSSALPSSGDIGLYVYSGLGMLALCLWLAADPDLLG